MKWDTVGCCQLGVVVEELDSRIHVESVKRMFRYSRYLYTTYDKERKKKSMSKG